MQWRLQNIFFVSFIPQFNSPMTFMDLSALHKHSWTMQFQKEVPSVKPRTPCLLQLGNCSKSSLPVSGLSCINPPILRDKAITVSSGSFPSAQHVFKFTLCPQHLSCKSSEMTRNNPHRETVNLCSHTYKKSSQPSILSCTCLYLRILWLKHPLRWLKNNSELFMSFIWQVTCGLCALIVEELTRSPSTGPPE